MPLQPTEEIIDKYFDNTKLNSLKILSVLYLCMIPFIYTFAFNEKPDDALTNYKIAFGALSVVWILDLIFFSLNFNKLFTDQKDEDDIYGILFISFNVLFIVVSGILTSYFYFKGNNKSLFFVIQAIFIVCLVTLYGTVYVDK